MATAHVAMPLAVSGPCIEHAIQSAHLLALKVPADQLWVVSYMVPVVLFVALV